MEVIDKDAPASAVPEGQDGNKGKEPETVTLSKAEVDSLRRDRDEARQSERYWANVARGNGGRPAEPAGEPESELDAREFIDDDAPDGIEGDTPEKLVDEFAAKGVSALKARGFITAADAQKMAVEIAEKVSRELMGRERQKITSDAQLMSQFPELRDNQSELFKATAQIYQEAVAMDPSAKKTPAALFLAAKAAKAALKSKAPAAGGEHADETEADRRARTQSQDGRTRGRGDADTDDLLGDEAKQVIKAMGISEKEFKDSAKETRGATRRTR